ncbi:MAG TPA: exosome complex protein Rrp42 [Methanophagales archaeon]|nr:exosome complex protein Rrp42 [Methanophagales archaeon]
MGLEIMEDIKKDYVYDLIGNGKRVDGRGFHEYRDIIIERDVIKKAEGSARVQIGETVVFVGVKIEPGEPFPDTPNKGILMTNAELVPMASPEFETGPPGETSIEVARVVDRGIRGSETIDLEKLCIEEGEKVWMVFLDIHTLDNGGNLVDAAALGAIASLLNVHLPYERYGLTGEDTLHIRDTPVAVTAVEIEGNILVDPNLYEESAATSKLTVISNADGSVSGLQKSGSNGLKEETIVEMVEVGIEKAGEIREKYLPKI